MQGQLFDIPPVMPTDFCRTCVHRLAYQYPSTTISYCRMQKSNLTSNKLKKILARDPACRMYEKDQPTKIKPV